MKKEIIIKFEGSEILERTVSKFGTGCHIIVPKEYEGKSVKIILDASQKTKEKEKDENEKDKKEKGGKK